MLTGELTMPHAYTFRPGGGPLGVVKGVLPLRRERAPCLAYAIHHPTAGVIVVDTGLHRQAAEDLRKDFGPLMGRFFSGLRPADRPFDEQLRALEIEPQDGERVVMTHLHVDHTSGMRLLPGAEFVCSREEWSAATGGGAALKGYVARHLPPESRMSLVDFDRDGERYGPFSRTVDLLGDGSIRLLDTPGHTRGHLSVLLRMANGGIVLLVGDAAYTVRSIHEELLPLITDDDERSRRSLSELRAFAEAEPDATLVPSHDPTAWHGLREEEEPLQAATGAR